MSTKRKPEAKASKTVQEIPVGHYHHVMESGNPVRRAWHILKFRRALDLCTGPPGALLDVGCFAGSLLSLAPQEQFPLQRGVDILPEQVDFAQSHFGTHYRTFAKISSLRELDKIKDTFDYATCVEVIEHLTGEEIRELFTQVAQLLRPRTGTFILSTPNYASLWPALEVVLNATSDVDYSQQHISRFTYFGLGSKLRSLIPNFDALYELDVVTTTHWVSPFLGILGVGTALSAGGIVKHSKWRLPFGSLILFRLRRR